MAQDSIFSSPRRAFTLVEVVVAIGVFAVTIVAVLGLLSPISRSVAGVSDYDKAAQLGDAIQTELVRIRDVAGRGTTGLDRIANLINSESPLKLAASRDSSHVVHEAEAIDSLTSADPLALAKSDRYFLIEIREQPAPLNYTSGAGFIAVTATIKWPYYVSDGASGFKAPDASQLSQASSLLLNFAVPP